MEINQVILPKATNVNGEFGSRYQDFRKMFEDGRSIVGFLSQSAEEGTILQVNDIKSERLRHIAENLEESHERLLDEVDILEKDLGRTEFERICGSLSNTRPFLDYLEDNCRAYAGYFKDRGDPTHVLSSEASRVRPLPMTGSYFIEGQRQGIKKTIGYVLKAVFSRS